MCFAARSVASSARARQKQRGEKAYGLDAPEIDYIGDGGASSS
jgi:hypothetical protein